MCAHTEMNTMNNNGESTKYRFVPKSYKDDAVNRTAFVFGNYAEILWSVNKSTWIVKIHSLTSAGRLSSLFFTISSFESYSILIRWHTTSNTNAHKYIIWLASLDELIQHRRILFAFLLSIFIANLNFKTTIWQPIKMFAENTNLFLPL